MVAYLAIRSSVAVFAQLEEYASDLSNDVSQWCICACVLLTLVRAMHVFPERMQGLPRTSVSWCWEQRVITFSCVEGRLLDPHEEQSSLGAAVERVITVAGRGGRRPRHNSCEEVPLFGHCSRKWPFMFCDPSPWLCVMCVGAIGSLPVSYLWVGTRQLVRLGCLGCVRAELRALSDCEQLLCIIRIIMTKYNWSAVLKIMKLHFIFYF